MDCGGESRRFPWPQPVPIPTKAAAPLPQSKAERRRPAGRKREIRHNAVPMHLIGLDIGFSARSRTNAIAEIRDGELRVTRLNVPERDAALVELRDVDVIAIDAPLVPEGCTPETPRLVEQLLSRGIFQKRCKPGASHVPGTGHLLREHGRRSAETVAAAARWETTPPFPTVVPRAGIVEAFPNAFLGVALHDEAYGSRPKMARGSKFDWLYDQWIAHGLFSKAVMYCGLPPELTQRLNEERDHEHRAALICLLTAAFASAGESVAIGDAATGYFFLPSRDLWAEWAREALPPS